MRNKTQTRIEDLFKKARKAFGSDYQECIRYGKNALQLAKTVNNKDNVLQATMFIGKSNLAQNKFKEAIKWFKTVVDKKDEFGENDKMASCYTDLALAYWRYGEMDKPLKFFRKALTIHKKKRDTYYTARVLGNIGCFLNNLGEYKASNQKFEQAYQIFASIEKKLDMMITLGNIANNDFYLGDISSALTKKHRILDYFQKNDAKNIFAREASTTALFYKEIGNYEKAVEYALKSLKIKEKKGNQYSIAFTLNLIGAIYKEQGYNDKALDYYEKALKIRQHISHKSGIAATLNNLGLLHMENKKYKQALAYFQKSLKIKNELEDQYGKIFLYHNMGSIYFEMDEKQTAIKYYKKGLDIAEKIGNQYKITELKQDLADTYIFLGDFNQAETILAETQDYIQKEKNKVILKDNYHNYSKLYAAQKQYQQAFDYYQRYSSIKEELLSENKHKIITEMQVKYETEKKEYERKVALSKAEALSKKNAELRKKNEIIEKQKDKLQQTIEKLHKSEIKYNFISEELNKNIKTTLVGESEAIRNIIEMITVVSKSDKTNVLITGESGTGKEIVARNIHKTSKRGNKNFYAVNSAAIPETLFESQFFGHKKNAFTGANTTEMGWFEVADKSTLFLDEIGTMSLSQQAKLLRVLEERKIVRIGSHRSISIDVRMISATNNDLLKLLEQKKFRADLYHRIATFVISIPPLRERKEDIPLLLRHFVKLFNRNLNKKITRIDNKVEDILLNYDYPGNVRELRNIIERAVLISDSSTLQSRHLVIPQKNSKHSVETDFKSLQEREIDAIKKALRMTNFNQTRAAKLLQIKRKALARRIKKYALEQFLEKNK